MPSDPAAPPGALHGVAGRAAAQIERWLRRDEPTVMAIGTGRTLKAAIEQLTPMEAPQHKIVSLTGSIAPDGSAAYLQRHFQYSRSQLRRGSFPMPLPVICVVGGGAGACCMSQSNDPLRNAARLAQQANITFVGIGDLGLRMRRWWWTGYSRRRARVKQLQKAGAVGEIVRLGAVDAQGRYHRRNHQ
ncbi:MAG: sugar-binding domain-containing protein [Agrobacterium sp.]|nr:sugar-binding domain-containing protein [Agrobacterium sp.]